MKSNDFFAAQDRARRKSFWLRIVFLLYIVAFSVFSGFCLSYLIYIDYTSPTLVLPEPSDVDFFWPALVFFLVVVLGTLFMSRRIRNLGVDGLLEFSGAKRVAAPFKDNYAKRCHNVVHEMAVASGVPIPKLYVLPDDNSINAFTAGISANDNCIVVTAGAMQHLSRSELQGVIAHEFSHILNGDVKLNIDLISVIHGYSVVAYVGRRLLHSRVRWSIVGVPIAVMGFFGEIFAAIIRAGHSRQREWLADASAVQFTRNPEGLRGALQKVDQNLDSKLVGLRNAEDFAHMFFVGGITGFLVSTFKSHPPLEERIRALGHPRYRSPSEKVVFRSATGNDDFEAGAASTLKGDSVSASGDKPLNAAQKPNRSYSTSIDGAGRLSPESIVAAVYVLQDLPKQLVDDLEMPLKARALAVAIVLHFGSAERDGILSELAQKGLLSQSIAEYIRHDAFPLLKRITFARATALLDLACEQLCRQKNLNKIEFISNLILIVKNDAKTSPQELVMMIYLVSRLLQTPEIQRLGSETERSDPRTDVAQLTAFVAYAGAGDNLSKAGSAYELAMSQFGWPNQPLPSAAGLQVESLLRAAGHIRAAPPKNQKRFVSAIAQAISLDKQVNENEHYLLRALCMCMGCPIPMEAQS
jgi:Zn-dependent protease with chaperone function